MAERDHYFTNWDAREATMGMLGWLTGAAPLRFNANEAYQYEKVLDDAVNFLQNAGIVKNGKIKVAVRRLHPEYPRSTTYVPTDYLLKVVEFLYSGDDPVLHEGVPRVPENIQGAIDDVANHRIETSGDEKNRSSIWGEGIAEDTGKRIQFVAASHKDYNVPFEACAGEENKPVKRTQISLELVHPALNYSVYLYRSDTKKWERFETPTEVGEKYAAITFAPGVVYHEWFVYPQPRGTPPSTSKNIDVLNVTYGTWAYREYTFLPWNTYSIIGTIIDSRRTEEVVWNGIEYYPCNFVMDKYDAQDKNYGSILWDPPDFKPIAFYDMHHEGGYPLDCIAAPFSGVHPLGITGATPGQLVAIGQDGGFTARDIPKGKKVKE